MPSSRVLPTGSVIEGRRQRKAVRAAAFFTVVPTAFLLSVCVEGPAFAARVGSASSGSLAMAGQRTMLCGRPDSTADASTAAMAMSPSLSWMNPTRWGGQQVPMLERLSHREWLRMYRTLGLSEDSSRDQVQRATARLRRKYADNEPALERVEAANLWIMTKLVSQKEEVVRQRQQANRLRELGDSPRRLVSKYVLGYLPPSIQSMLEAPTMAYFRRASGLCGLFALLGLCAPTQATNFVGLAAASAMGLIYTRGRPEPVRDEMGNPGEVRQMNYKEMAGCIGVVALATLLGCGICYFAISVADAPMQAAFVTSTCFMFWLASLFFKVYQVFD